MIFWIFLESFQILDGLWHQNIVLVFIMERINPNLHILGKDEVGIVWYSSIKWKKSKADDSNAIDWWQNCANVSLRPLCEPTVDLRQCTMRNPVVAIIQNNNFCQTVMHGEIVQSKIPALSNY